jgi:steroid 5-alpha reductase family enzyme
MVVHSFTRHARSFLQIGSRIGFLETIVAYILPFLFLQSSATDLKQLMIQNLMCQFAEFLVIVQIPLALTSKMAYVDLGWPLGLMILGLNGLIFGKGWFIRRWIVCASVIIHGGRMFFGIYLISLCYCC